MRRSLLSGLALFSLVLLGFVVLSVRVPAQKSAAPSRIPLVQDWSHRHLIFSNTQALQLDPHSRPDPRMLHAWLSAHPEVWQARSSALASSAFPAAQVSAAPSQQTDWAVSLGGTAGMTQGETPAKFTFDITQPPSCENDFVVFVIGTAPTAGTQANIVALKNLYTGPTSSSCGVLTGPTFKWSYAAGTGRVILSPALSLDGQKVAFVESINPARLDVLTWVTGQGTNATTGSVAPGAGGSALTRINYTNTVAPGCTRAASTNSNSSPYIDYQHDAAFIGADNGRLYHISGIFNGTPTVDFCITVNAGRRLTAPVYVSTANTVFVTDRTTVYAYTVGPNSFIPAGSVQLGSTTSAISNSLLVDGSAGWVYAFARNNLTNTNSIVSQMPFSLATHVDAPIGLATTNVLIFSGDFDNQYYTRGPAAGTLYACGTQLISAAKPSLYSIQFGPTGIMNPIPTMNGNINITNNNNPNGACSPLLELFNGTQDRLFVGVNGGIRVNMFDITTPLISSLATPNAISGSMPGGTSGFVPDNFSAIPQASSIYFGTLGQSAASPCGANLFCAVKLTQSALQ